MAWWCICRDALLTYREQRAEVFDGRVPWAETATEFDVHVSV
ncbi:hypothetical protein ACIBCN_06655 [Nocardia sp. NPDC051052]